MEWHKRHFDDEGSGEGQEQPHLHSVIKSTVEQGRQVQCVAATGCLVVIVAQRDDAGQHQEATYRGIQHELECRVNTAVAPPPPNQEKKWDQQHLPEKKEKEKGGGQE